MTRPRVSLLVRHRWLGDPIRELYRCTRGVPSLYETYDAICYGCGAKLPWADVPGLSRYRGYTWHPLVAEDLGLRLDLRVAELQIQGHACEPCAEMRRAS